MDVLTVTGVRGEAGSSPAAQNDKFVAGHWAAVVGWSGLRLRRGILRMTTALIPELSVRIHKNEAGLVYGNGQLRIPLSAYPTAWGPKPADFRDDTSREVQARTA